jgi:hypothetical protein
MDDPYTPSLGSARTTFLPLPGGEGWGEGEPLSLFFATNYSVQLLPFFSGHIDYLESTTVLTLRFRKSKSFA